MIEIRRILCPIDFSDHSRRALDHAIAVARWYESTLTVLHVFSPAPVTAFGPGPVVFEPIILTSADRDQLLADTKAFAETESAPGITIEAVVREGNTAGEILEQATSMKADLLVISTHGRSGFERLLLGSVAEKVLRKVSCPVMTVPRRLPDAVPAGPILYKRILCPVDFAESSLHALKYAMSMAQEADGQLTIPPRRGARIPQHGRHGERRGRRDHDHLGLHEGTRRGSSPASSGSRCGRVRVLQRGVADDTRKALARSSTGRHRNTERPHRHGCAGAWCGRSLVLWLDDTARGTGSIVPGADAAVRLRADRSPGHKLAYLNGIEK
jgi:universal stress protein A